MAAWWEGLTLFQQVLACVTIPATLILVIQFVLLLLGLGDSDSFEGLDEPDLDGMDTVNDTAFVHVGGLRLITFRGVIAFLSVGGWVAIALVAGGLSPVLAGIIGFVCGALAMLGVAYVMKAAEKLQSAGNVDMQNAVGRVAKVYIPIPPKHQGKGKVTLTVQERFIEADAETAHDQKLKTGMSVRVERVTEGNTLVVSPLE